jgi:carboxyl-terminal processing protease
MQGGLQGMMEALDPYSSFIDRKTYQEIQRSRGKLTASPGIILSKRYGYAYVVSVVSGSPAQRRGLRTGDLLESIDGEMTGQMSLWEARKLLLGTEGSSVHLRVIRARRSAPSQVELVRENIPLPEVSARIVEEGIGLLSIPHFEEGTAQLVSAKLKMLLSSGMRGLLVDVRGTALGAFEEAVEISDLFLPKGKRTLTVSDRDEKKTEFFSLTEPLISDIRVVLLMDRGSSGAAEVFVAALKDHDIAGTVGERSDGQGSVQEFIYLEDGSVLEILTGLFYRSTGAPIQSRELNDSGISPEVRSPDPDFVTNFYLDNTSDEDDAALRDDFYQELNSAIRALQFEEGLKQVRSMLLKEAA